MKHLKKLLSALICCTIVLGSTGTAFAKVGDANKLGNGEQQIQKEEMLTLVEQQLKDQNAEKFYPIYEQMINNMYNNSLATTNSLMKAKPKISANFKNGGIIYYKNYLGTKVEMTNTYLSQAEYNRVIARKPISQSFTEWVAVVGVGLINATLGVMFGFDMYVEDNILYNNIVDAGGAYICVTEDATAIAKIVLPWKSHPYAQYYEGATVIFR